MKLTVLTIITSSLVVSAEFQCEKDDLSCAEGTETSLLDESLYNSYKNKDWTSREDFPLRQQLDRIDEIKKGDPDQAMKEVERILKEFPESPRALNSLSKIYRILFNKLSPEFHSIGRIEYLNKMVQVITKVVKMDREKVPFLLLRSMLEFGLANTKAMGEGQKTIELLREIVFGPRKDEFDEEDKEFYFQTLLDESFYREDYETCKELIMEKTKNLTSASVKSSPSISMTFLMAVLTRIEQSKSGDPFMSYPEGMIESITPKDQEEKDDLVLYVMELEKELREQKKVDIVNIMYDLLVELKIFPSRYQRSTTHMQGLTARPVWKIEETEYQDKLEELQNNWEIIRDEALALMKHTPSENITLGEAQLVSDRKWKQYVLHGFGGESFPSWICEHTPVTCALLKDYPYATRCHLGTIKFSVLEPGTHIKPHVGGVNFKLRAHLPLVVPKPNSTETENMARMVVAGEHELVWEEGKVLVFDDSFEHEVWNFSSGTRVILIIDLLHPDMTPEQFAELENMFSFKEGEKGYGNVAAMAGVSSA